MNIYRLMLAWFTTLFALGAGWLTVVPSGIAAVGYGSVPTGMFGTPGSGDGQFSHPAGLAIDEGSGDLYVADLDNNRVQIFDAEGNYLGKFDGSGTPAGSFSGPYSITVDNSAGPAAGDVYVTDRGHDAIDVFNAQGRYLSEITGTPTSFGELLGIAVDSSGHLWVYECEPVRGNGHVDEFSDTGALVGRFKTNHETEPGFAVDAKGNLYMLFGTGAIGKYRVVAESESIEKLAEWGTGQAVAVDPSTNDVFLATRRAIEEFGPFGEPLGVPMATFPAEATEYEWIAMDGKTGTVYASNSAADSVDIFKHVLLADVSTGVASNIGGSTAVIGGTVKREGLPTTYRFQYGETIAYGTNTPSGSIVGEEEEVNASLSNLRRGTTYHYRLVAEDKNGVNYGTDRTFTTLPAVEGLATHEASSILRTEATLEGSLEPNGLDAHYWFEYGKSNTYGSSTAKVDAGSTSGPVHASATLAGLKASTLYHFRIVAENEDGITYGNDVTLLTAPAVEGLKTDAVIDLLPSSVTFNGSFEPKELDTQWWFEYGSQGSYASRTPPQDAGSGKEVMHVSAAVGGLIPNETYNYRLTAENTLGTTEGNGVLFTTPAIPPEVMSTQASFVGFDTAGLTGSIDPEHSNTSYWFEYGQCTEETECIATSYTNRTPAHNSSVYGDVGVSQEIERLRSSTAYHYRLVAENQACPEGKARPCPVVGREQSFTTESAPALTVVTGTASAMTPTSAMISGTVESHGLASDYGFEIGTQAGVYGPEIGTGTIEAGVFGARSLILALQNLEPGTTYHYRLVARTVHATAEGADGNFATVGSSSVFSMPSALQVLPVPEIEFPSGERARPTVTRCKRAFKRSRKGRCVKVHGRHLKHKARK